MFSDRIDPEKALPRPQDALAVEPPLCLDAEVFEEVLEAHGGWRGDCGARETWHRQRNVPELRRPANLRPRRYRTHGVAQTPGWVKVRWKGSMGTPKESAQQSPFPWSIQAGCLKLVRTAERMSPTERAPNGGRIDALLFETSIALDPHLRTLKVLPDSPGVPTLPNHLG